jgi:DNA mismatch repair protein MutL
VVENPASVVKEIVENALDAGASAVIISVKGGGIEEIEIADNGSGIPKDDLLKTILPHATSKISVASDLDAIKTLGFRGEALASIAAVSDFSLVSRHADSHLSYKLSLDNGAPKISETSGDVGTRVTVNNLFFNVPARYKFLKKPVYEEGYVTALVKKFVLTRPFVAFTYYLNGKLALKSDGTGLTNALSTVYKIENSNFLSVYREENGVKLSGYIAVPAFTKSTREGQIISVNGRIVEDLSVSSSVQNAFADRLMTRTFPIFVLEITLNENSVDVNVHPNKKQVKFENARSVLSLAYGAVQEALNEYEEKLKKELFGNSEEKPFKVISGDPASQLGTPNDDLSADDKMTVFGLSDTVTLADRGVGFKNLRFDFAKEDVPMSFEKFPDYFTRQMETGNVTAEPQRPSNDVSNATYKTIGQAFATYLFVECGDELYIIDQHAAHERLLFDELVAHADANTAETQPLLLPVEYPVGAEFSQKLTDAEREFVRLGFVLRIENDSVTFLGVPTAATGIDFGAFLTKLEKDLEGGLLLSGILRDKLARAACRAAIKGGDALTPLQAAQITTNFISKGIPLQCPHGRPVFVKFAKLDLEKLFKRVL